MAFAIWMHGVKHGIRDPHDAVFTLVSWVKRMCFCQRLTYEMRQLYKGETEGAAPCQVFSERFVCAVPQFKTQFHRH